ncbi:preprotein translocase subunit YajC [Schaalia sp. JY-X169]|uniref:preprotein translocase subunit YajC n=1 Tax=Schaalia sp. JY-X169 TaxID=2758572 RepID=UPI0015F606F8|nr:preprotein translocase subunit YajC [Schaalia sp. JY-X169]
MEILLFMAVLVGGMFVMNSFAKKSQKKRQDEAEKTMSELMVPGAWVQTYSGFFGRFVDTDGDVIILETPSGEETYWLRAAIRAVTDPPFETLGESEDDIEVDVLQIESDVDGTDESEQLDGVVDLDGEVATEPTEESNK